VFCSVFSRKFGVIFVVILIFCLFSACQKNSASDVFYWRDSRLGMAMDEVKEIENISAHILDLLNWIYVDKTIPNFNVDNLDLRTAIVMYCFCHNIEEKLELCSAHYQIIYPFIEVSADDSVILPDGHDSIAEMRQDYLNIKKALIEKYAEPDNPEDNFWRASPNVDPFKKEEYGLYFIMGDYFLSCSWTRGNTVLVLQLIIDSHLTISFFDKTRVDQETLASILNPPVIIPSLKSAYNIIFPRR